MTTLWTCDIDENEVEERCAKDATYIVTWYDEADAEQNRAGNTLKVCKEHRDEVEAGVWETPAVVDVAVARIDRTPEPATAQRPTQWCWPHLERGEFVAADTTVDDQGHPSGICSVCLAESSAST